MSDDNVEEVVTTPRRRKVAAVVVGDVNLDRIRNGEWRDVIAEVGSEEYNRLRLIALK